MSSEPQVCSDCRNTDSDACVRCITEAEELLAYDSSHRSGPETSACWLNEDCIAGGKHDGAACVFESRTDDAPIAGGDGKTAAEIWDEAAEAISEWMWNNPGPSGVPHDPPLNPYL